jgi:hypothetical protein
MADTRDTKQRPLVHAFLTGTVSGITRAVLDWFIDRFLG